MDWVYHFYCKVATVIFLVYTAYPVTTKLVEQRLVEDWLHSMLHLLSALVAAYAAWLAPKVAPAKLFTLGIGLFYSVLGAYGWFTPGLLLNTPFALPLGTADNVFHLLLGVSALVVAMLHVRTSL